MISTQKTRLEKLSSLTPDEKKIVPLLTNAFRNPNLTPDERKKMIAHLDSFHLNLIYALSENSPEINTILETDETLTQSWSATLCKMQYPDHAIESFDKQTKLSIFSQIKGMVLLDELDKNPDLNHPESLAILNKACEIGMFNALTQRINFYISKIGEEITGKNDIDVIDKYSKLILIDTTKLSNLYWASGCLETAKALFYVLNYYFENSGYQLSVERFFYPLKINQFSWQSKYSDPNCPYPILILEAAMECLYLTHLLTQFPESELITQQVSHGQGLFSEQPNEFKNPGELQRLVKKKLDALKIQAEDAFCQKAFDKAKERVLKIYPDAQLPKELPSFTPTKNSI